MVYQEESARRKVRRNSTKSLYSNPLPVALVMWIGVGSKDMPIFVCGRCPRGVFSLSQMKRLVSVPIPLCFCATSTVTLHFSLSGRG
jgi:hypothetical protein